MNLPVYLHDLLDVLCHIGVIHSIYLNAIREERSTPIFKSASEDIETISDMTRDDPGSRAAVQPCQPKSSVMAASPLELQGFQGFQGFRASLGASSASVQPTASV